MTVRFELETTIGAPTVRLGATPVRATFAGDTDHLPTTGSTAAPSLLGITVLGL